MPRRLLALVAAALLAPAAPAHAFSWKDVTGENAPPSPPPEKPGRAGSPPGLDGDAPPGLEGDAPPGHAKGSGGGLNQATLAGGLKETLRLAVTRAIDDLGRKGGYLNDEAVHIPLPKSLRRVQDTLDSVGLGTVGDSLERRLNRAAERAAPEARDILIDAAMQMSLKDARAIATGPSDAATAYFRRTSADALRGALRPVIDKALDDAGAVQVYQQMLDAYAQVPFVPKLDADLTRYTTRRALDGLFHRMAEAEARIRNDPAAVGSSLVQRIFGR